ncbi:unnamed protein product [Acidithrix sp. C25]|nr:unnamed protein product [Acidithrix sp. C25]
MIEIALDKYGHIVIQLEGEIIEKGTDCQWPELEYAGSTGAHDLRL